MSDKKQYKPELMSIQGKPYLGAHDAIAWFRTEFPLPRSQIIVYIDDLENSVVRCEITVDNVLVSTADVRGDGTKSLEKLETAAVRRALAYAGYGTVSAIAQEDNPDTATDAQKAAVEQALHEKGMTARDMMNGGKKKRVGGKPTKTPKSAKTNWANKKSVESIFNIFRAKELTDNEIMGFANVDKWNNYRQWNEYESVDDAIKQIDTNWDAELKIQHEEHLNAPAPTEGDEIAFQRSYQMSNDGMYMFKGYYVPCDSCDGENGECPQCNGDGWICTDNEEWHPYGTEFAEYDKRDRSGYFVTVLCPHCGYKMPVCYEYNIVDKRYHADTNVCGCCDKELSWKF